MREEQREILQAIDEHRAALAEEAVSRHYELQPELAARYGPGGRAKCLQDLDYHLLYLAEAIGASSPLLFADYVEWAKVLLAGFNIPENDLATNLICLREALQKRVSAGAGAIAAEYIQAGTAKLSKPVKSPSFINEESPLHSLAGHYLQALLRSDRRAASQMILDAVQQGTSVKDIYLRVFQPVQQEIGRLWQTNRISVAQEHYCTAATQLVMSQLYPYIFAGDKIGRRLIASCVGGELHEIGIRMVADFFEMEGWDTYYLGANTPTASILQSIEERRADVLAISATMTFHLSKVTQLIDKVRASEIGRGIKILVGGYPFNVSPELWRQVGADGYSTDAQQAIDEANRLLGPR
jgi:MerR family transcriptional regulator, light-induced transcriptional regulator